MSSEEQDLAHNLAPFSLPTLSPPDVATDVQNSAWRVGSSQPSQKGLISSQSGQQFLSDSQFDNMGATVGLLPAPPELVIPPGPGPGALPLQMGLGMGLTPTAVPFLPNGFLLDAGAAVLTAPPQPRHPSLTKGHGEHKNSKASRRGPMDEMRQLVRILVKLMPDSSRFLTVPDEGGGGNRVKEEHIKDYLNKVLGRSQDLRDDTPPYPDWGLVNGWAAYLSELFTWARGAPITPDQALRCARRLPGRSWETLNDELEKLRLCPQAWPLPLRKEAVREVQKKYEETGQLPPVVPRPPPAVQIATTVGPQLLLVDASAVAAGTVAAGATELTQFTGADNPSGAKRQLTGGHLSEIPVVQPGQQPVQVAGAQNGQAVYAQVAGTFAQHAATALPAAAWLPQPPAPKRRKKPGSSGSDLVNLSEYSELELWHLALKVVQEAESKRNTTPPNRLGDLQTTHDMVRRVVERFTPGAGVSGAVGLGTPLVAAPGVAPGGYPPPQGSHQPHQPQAAAGGATAGPGGPPALLTVAPGPSAAGAAAAGMDAATQLKTRLMMLPHGGLAGPQGGHVMQVLSHSLQGHPLGAGGTAAWAKAPAAQPPSGGGAQSGAPHQAQLAAGAPGTPSNGSEQGQTAASLTTIQQFGAAQHTQGYAGQLAALAAPPQQQQPLVQPSQQAPPQPSQPSQQQQPAPSQPLLISAPAASVVVGTSIRHEGSGGANNNNNTTVSDSGLKTSTAKDTGREASGRPGDVRLGSSSGAFQKYDNQKLIDKFENSKYDKGSGGLEALAAAAAELGERCGAEQDEPHDGRRRGTSAGGATSPPPPPTHGQQTPYHSAQNTADNQVVPRAGGATVSSPHQLEQRRGENPKSNGRGTITALEDMDETETRVPQHRTGPAESVEVDGPTGPQAASSVALPRSAKELRTRVHLQMDQAAQDVEEGSQQQRDQQQHHQQEPPPVQQLQQQQPTASSPRQQQQQQRQATQHSTSTQNHTLQQQQQQQQPHSAPTGPAGSGGPVATELVSPTAVAVTLSQPLGAVQTSPGPAGSQTLIYHLLPPVDSLAALAHRGIMSMPYPAQLGLGQQIINAGQQYLLVTGQMPSLVTSQMQSQCVLTAAPATATISASVPIGVSQPAVVQPAVIQSQVVQP